MNDTTSKLIKQWVVPVSLNPLWNTIIIGGIKCPRTLCAGKGKKKTYHTIYQLNYHLSYHHRTESIEQRKEIVNALLMLIAKGVLQTERKY